MVSISQEKTLADPIVGACTMEDLTQGEFGEYFKEYYRPYQSDGDVIAELKPLVSELDITIVLGTWCHDSQVQVPRFFRVMEEAGFDLSRLELICVDTEKEFPGQDDRDLGIERVPTFIFYSEGEEIGRIVETPVQSLEEDFLILVEDIK